MEKTYKNIWILFFAILLIIFLGFFRTYFSLFPKFENVSIAQHFHSLIFLLWFALLFIQPYLIKSGRIVMHRRVGKISYVLVPLLVISIFEVAKGQYHRELTQFPVSQCIANLIIPLPQIVLFLIIFLLAMINTKNTAYHMRYIISSTLVLLGPGLGRIFIGWLGMSFPQAVMSSFIVTELILVSLIVYDRFQINKCKPYIVLLLLLVSSHLAWLFLPESSIWQNLCGRFVEIVF